MFLSFLIILQRESFILSVLKLDQQANHAFEMTYSKWKSTAPQLPCIFYHTAFMWTASVTSPHELLLWVIFIDFIKVQISNECDNQSGPLARNHQDFIIILGWYQQNQTLITDANTSRMAQIKRSQVEAEVEMYCGQHGCRQDEGLEL